MSSELTELRREFREKEQDYETAAAEEAHLSKLLMETRETARRAKKELDEVRAELWEAFTVFIATEEPPE